MSHEISSQWKKSNQLIQLDKWFYDFKSDYYIIKLENWFSNE